MKLKPFVIVIFILFSCKETVKNNNTKNNKELELQTLTTSLNESIKFKKVTSQGVLLSNKIMLLDDSLNSIKDISKYNKSFVEIIAVSEKMYNEADDYCKEFNYVKIKSEDFEGIINGRLIFEILDSTQNKKNDTISFSITSFLGVGPFQDNEVTDCIETAPTILIENKTGSKSLIYMIKNKHYKSSYDYFSLNSDSEIWDKILEIKKVDENFQLQIKTTWQDGGELFTVEISKNSNGKYFAEILNKSALN